VRHKGEIDRRVARELRLRSSDVSRVTAEFLRQVADLLKVEGAVTLDGFGHFRVELVEPKNGGYRTNLTSGNFKKGARAGTRTVEVKPYVRVHFSQATKLKKDLKMSQPGSDQMEKYGVDETAGVNQEQLEKQAAKGCPSCGKELTKHGSVLMCPDCGSEPFEQPQGDGHG
jgi:nucleoid DNA-binding protein/predicted RNA-binding Zn-ribbon protein involved in translation (DUF1610 family)